MSSLRSLVGWVLKFWWRIRNCLRLFCDQMRGIQRSLQTWLIVIKIQLDANPVWGGAILVVALLIYGFLSIAVKDDVPINRWGWLVREIIVEKIANPWQRAVRCRLLGGGTQSPVGDYLALEVVVLFLGKVVEKILYRTSSVNQKFARGRPVSLMRGVLVALILLVNLVVTGLISYGFLWPLPLETPLRVLYWGLAGFMFVVGFGSSVFSVVKAFPVRRELIGEAITDRRNRAMMLSAEARERRNILKSRSRVDSAQPSVVRLSCFLEWDLTNRPPSLRERFRSARKNFLLRKHEDPRFSLGRQIVLAWVVRFGAFILMVTVSLVSSLVRQPIMSAKMWSLWVSGLVFLGATNSIAVCLGAFKGRFRSGVFATVCAIFFDVMILGALMGVMYSELAGSGATDAAKMKIIGTLSSLLVILEYFCVLLAFEVRDPALVSLVREKRSLVRQTHLLHGYYRKNFRKVACSKVRTETE